LKLLHFSDPHIQLPDWRKRPLRKLGPLRALATVELWKGRGKDYDGALESLRAIVRDAAEADHAVLTGDLTQLGLEEEFALAQEALSPLRGKLTAIAGNHDRYPLGGTPNRCFERHFPEQAATTSVRVELLGDEAALLCVDSAGTLSWPVVSNGRLTTLALEALSLALRDPLLAGRCKLVLVHHAPLLRGGRRDWPHHSLRGAAALLRVAAEGGAEAILCGHVHDRFDVPAAPGRARVICAGSSTKRGEEGYWVLEVERGRLASATAMRP
jgi:3',5'-cyclic AMP phosphodiesterase CpdA